MSLIDPNLFKAEPEVSDGRPFAPAGPAGPGPDIANFRDSRPLTRWVSGFVWVDIAFSAALGLMMLAEASGMAQVMPLDETLDPTLGQMIFSLTAMVYIGFIIPRILIILRWFWRANKNARALSGGIETTPGWAWGFFFIPIMNLWRPFQTMEEIWASAQNPGHWRTIETPVLMRWWWGLWLVGNIVDNVSGRLVGNVDTLQFGAVIAVIGYSLSIAGNIAFLGLINPIARNQWAHSQDSVFD